MISIVAQVQQAWTGSCRTICRELAMPRSSLLRWQQRQRAGLVLIRRPGPAKVRPLDFDALRAELRALPHGRQRTRGSGALYARHRAELSRRDFQAMLGAIRREVQQEQQAQARRVEWLVPGAVWSMDDTKKHWLTDRFGHLHLVMDLASRCNLRALGAAEQATGQRVAASLQALFDQYGPPLFLKMDGGGNFKAAVVQQLLAERGVIPLVSPPHYPPYNGGIERQHQDVLRYLVRLLGDRQVSASELLWACGVAGHEVNHVRRRSLRNQTPCQSLAGSRALLGQFDRRKREEVFEQLKDLTVDIVEALREHTTISGEAAFRYAAEIWMQSNNMIRVIRQREVLPCFYRLWSH
jgi:transposase InsO family protein